MLEPLFKDFSPQDTEIKEYLKNLEPVLMQIRIFKQKQSDLPEGL
jgi:hypothetical protein